MIQKQPQYKENTTRLYPRNRPQDNSKKESKQNYYNFQLNLNRMEKTQYINILQAKQSDA